MSDKLKRTEWEQVLFYLKCVEQEGVYYGNKAQFNKRHEHIKEYLIDRIQELS